MRMEIWVLLSMVAATGWFRSVASLTPDGEALLEVKMQLNDSQQVLSDWRSSDSTPCNWIGINCDPHDLRVTSIILPYRHLAGTIHPNIGKLTRLQRLAFHGNSLHGSIPPEMSNLTALRALYLRDNRLEGEIPEELGQLPQLLILDLSSNLLNGSIPPSLGHLARLQLLNLSNNFLSGEIPKNGALGAFSNYSFFGNSDLCGHQIGKLCRNAKGFPAVLPVEVNDTETEVTPPRRTSQSLYILLIGGTSAVGLALLLLLGLLWACLSSKYGRFSKTYSKVHKQIEPDSGAKLVIFRGDLPYPPHDIVRRIELLDETDVIGVGGFGTAYKLVMEDNCAFAVKRIDRNREGSDQKFERELENLGSLKHMNLVSLRGYCIFPSAKLLIYDYMIRGSLDTWLHEYTEADPVLNWNARLRIALGSARGLAYLHHDCSPAIVHRDIKASNILLDENLEPHVSDFGLAKLLVDSETQVTTVVAGTFGYLAPEYLHSGRATEKSDVFSFGVLLLELVSGKRPTDPEFVRKGLNIVGWLNTLMRENRLEEIVDKACTCIIPETVVAVLEIAVKCTEANPDDRPSMNVVLQMLEEGIMSPCPSEFYETHSDC
ncbi:LRR receptor-like serine/threonine-protein kinase FEI 2 [Nymphaea colorata]|nr:LRR receptor-like serine/threonine-protein kinase FEI 2 [Nymphaea colorata]